MEYLRVKNWEQFQQYKDREPKWIKLHRSLLRDYSFGKLSDTQKAHLLVIWLLAAETDNKIPNDADWIKSQGQLSQKPDLNLLISTGFLILENPVQNCTDLYIEAVHRDREETETYSKETEKEYMPLFEEFWDSFPTNGRGKGSKKKAEQRYSKIYQNHLTIMHGVRNYETYLRSTGEYNSDAVTWLNGERWCDEYGYRNSASKQSWKEAGANVMEKIRNSDLPERGGDGTNGGIEQSLQISKRI